MLHGRISWADGYGDDKLPSFERYFMGGPTSLRGYNIKNIGPKDGSGNPIGGNQSLVIERRTSISFHKGVQRISLL